MRAAFIIFIFILDRERGAAEKFILYFLHKNRGAVALQKRGTAEKCF